MVLRGNDIAVMEAYIPKGTEYYVDVYCREVCAKQLYITDKIIKDAEELLTYEETMAVVQPVIDGISFDKMPPGWIYTSDKKFVHPSSYGSSSMNALGVVACM